MAVYEERSVTAAAVRLSSSQPSVSAALARLRVALHDPLFLKTSHGVEPTARAKAVVEPIRLMLHLLDEQVLADQRFSPQESVDEFRFALSDLSEAIFLPPLLSAISLAAPRARVRSLSMKVPALEIALEKGEIDLAVGSYPDLKSKNIHERLVASYSFASIVRVGHPVAGRTIDLAEFAALRHGVVEFEGRTHELFEDALRQLRIEREVALRVPHFLSIPSIVKATDLLFTVPDMFAASLVSAGDAALVDVPVPMPTGQVKCHWHSSANQDPKSQWLRQIVMLALTLERIRPLTVSRTQVISALFTNS